MREAEVAKTVAARYREQPLLVGYQGVKSPYQIGLGGAEGRGLYLTKYVQFARFFSHTRRAAKFRYRQPINPLFIGNNDPMYLDQRPPELTRPVATGDGEWTVLNKQAAAASWRNQTPPSAELTRLLMISGYDAVVADGVLRLTEAIEWTVLIDPELIATAYRVHNEVMRPTGNATNNG